MNLNSSMYRRILVLCAVVALACSAAGAQTAGAIFTSMPVDATDAASLAIPVDHWIVDANTQYPGKQFVFLNGGPRNTSSAGLTPGTYFYQVTSPSGVLLSTDPAICRQVLVDTNGRIAGAVAVTSGPFAGCEHIDLGVDPIRGGVPVSLCRRDAAADGTDCYDDTPNPGGEYKTSLIPVANVSAGGEIDNPSAVLEFSQNGVKNDNFKVKLCTDNCEPPPPCPEDRFTDECPPASWPLEGRKFYDVNANGAYDEGTDVLLEGWKVRGIGDSPMIEPEVNAINYGVKYYSAIVSTDVDGKYAFGKLTTGGTYGVCEIFPIAPAGSTWMATAPRPENYSLGDLTWESQIFCPRHIESFDDGFGNTFTGSNEYSCWAPQNDPSLSEPPNFALFGVVNILPGRGPVDFGNVCLGAGGGKTLGFWSNKNGQALINGTDLAMLTALNLRNAAGANFDPGTYAAFRTWILNATATNMAYMTSAQLAAMELNVFNGLVNGGSLLFAGTAPAGCTVSGLNGAGFISVTDLMSAANASLGLYGVTLSGHPQRACQEFMKNALDNGNNNLNFVQAPGSCPVSYAGTEDCTQGEIDLVLEGIDKSLGPMPAPSSNVPNP